MFKHVHAASLPLQTDIGAGMYDMHIGHYSARYKYLKNKINQFYISRCLTRENCVYCNEHYTYTVIINAYFFLKKKKRIMLFRNGQFNIIF